MVFADPAGSTYTQDFFDQAQRVEWIGAFRTRPLPYSDMVRSINMMKPRNSRRSGARLISTEDDGIGSVFGGDGDDVNVAINATMRSSRNLWWPQGSSALPADAVTMQPGIGEEEEEEEEEVIGWYYYAGGRHSRHQEVGSEWSAIALNARLLWREDQEEDGTQNHHRRGSSVKPWWIKGWHDISNGGREIRVPLDLVKDSSFIESLGIY